MGARKGATGLIAAGKSIRKRASRPSVSEPRLLLSVAVSRSAAVPSVLRAGADRLILGGEAWRRELAMLTDDELRTALRQCREAQVDLLWRLPRILNESQATSWRRRLSAVASWPHRPGILAANWGQVNLLHQIDPDWPWEADYSFNLFNRAAVAAVAEAGGHGACLSPELRESQIRELGALCSGGRIRLEILAFGDIEAMVSEYCPLRGAEGGCAQGASAQKPENGGTGKGRACQQEWVLQDRKHYVFPLRLDAQCRLHLFNACRLNLLPDLTKIAVAGVGIRLELIRLGEDPGWESFLEETIHIFRADWQKAVVAIVPGKLAATTGSEDGQVRLRALYKEPFTKGHFYRGV